LLHVWPLEAQICFFSSAKQKLDFYRKTTKGLHFTTSHVETEELLTP